MTATGPLRSGDPADGTAGPGSALPLPLRPPAHQVDPRAIWWWRLRALPVPIVLLVAQGASWALLPEWRGLLVATITLTVLWLLADTLVVPALRYRLHRWEVTEEAVYHRSGWLVREWRIAPIPRVQTVDTEHGPLQQALGLATVTVTTASARGPVRIAGLDAGAARELARRLTETTGRHPGDAT
ncbi:PH domain-containing protein [Pseudonocardia sp. C8]|uniref:PH domain-containing protein n=1 Tax=Pseudonocardia sp. C8 TaxID=2762759 RepID=UPI001642BD9C|nr:PH domain-containing protein [Pseudonocardia sp. C8]MBC3190668.1 PH domain-containing protein [Pseudonocardia sp. C8]